jgi:hypothetical protein
MVAEEKFGPESREMLQDIFAPFREINLQSMGDPLQAVTSITLLH